MEREQQRDLRRVGRVAAADGRLQQVAGGQRRDVVFSHCATVMLSHLSAFLASHGASSGIVLHILASSSIAVPRFTVANGFSVRGMVPL